MKKLENIVAYLTPEIGYSDKTPFAGGLGVLSGDHILAAAKKNIPLVAVSPLYHKIRTQEIDENGWQIDKYHSFHPEELGFRKLESYIEVPIECRRVRLTPWVKNLKLRIYQNHLISSEHYFKIFCFVRYCKFSGIGTTFLFA